MDSSAVGNNHDSVGMGAVWVYIRTGGVWTQQGPKIVGSGGNYDAEQGAAVSISADGNTLIEIGAGVSLGSAWIFTRSGRTWTQQGPILVGAINGVAVRNFLSVSISADGNTAIAGSPGTNYPAGVSVIFVRSGTTWTQQSILIGRGEVNQYNQGAAAGTSVAISADGNTAIMGGPYISQYSYNGAIWVFTRSGGTWTQRDEIIGSGNSSGGSDGVGNTVAMSADGNTILAGVWQDSYYYDQSTVKVYTRSGTSWSQQGFLPGGASVLAHSKSISISTDGSTAVLGDYRFNNFEGEALIYLPCSPISYSFTHIICQGRTYYFRHQNLSVSGTYIDTMTTIGGCDSVVTLTLYVQPDSFLITRSICQGATYAFAGQNLSVSGTYYDSLTSSLGCDSIVILNLTVGTSINTNLSQSICPGSSYTFNGQNLTATGIYSDTFVSVFGCDSIVTLTLTAIPNTSSSHSQSICQGSTYVFGSNILSAAGTYFDTLTSANGCDSIITLTLTVLPNSGSNLAQSICHGSTYTFDTNILSAAGTYFDTLTSANGCDSIITLTLTVFPNSGSSLSQSICHGSTYTFGTNILSAAGTYFDTLTSANGCDSIITLTSLVLPNSGSILSQNICQGSTYAFGVNILSAAGAYIDTLTSTNGCDSVITLTLTVLPNSGSSLSQSICQGSTYTFGSNNLSAAGTYYDTLGSINGCDSIVTLNLSILPDTVTAFFTLQPSGTPHLWYIVNQCTGTNITCIWDWGDNSPMTIGDTPSHMYTDSGFYNVCVYVTDSAGCSASYCDTNVYLFKNQSGQMVYVNVVNQLPNGINTIATQTLAISYYGGMVHFSEALQSSTSLKLYDLTGRVIISQDDFLGKEWNIPPGMAPGVYVIQLSNRDYSLSQKVTISQ
jgi:hypothetical protein